MLDLVVPCLAALLLAWFYIIWQNPKCNGKLPPGCMGFPIIGETMEYFSPYSLLEISAFMKKIIARCVPSLLLSVLTKINYHHSFVDHLPEELKKENTVLDEAIARDLVLLFIITASKMTTLAITLPIKLIADHPKVLAELTKEHEAIIKSREDKELEITKKEYKSMEITRMVINEVVRVGNLVPILTRKLPKDVEINGYTIPAGWFLVADPTVPHFDPNSFDEPFAFNPRRWEGKKEHVTTKTFMAFGRGAGFCVGANSAKLQIAIFLHHLVTKYRW